MRKPRKRVTSGKTMWLHPDDLTETIWATTEMAKKLGLVSLHSGRQWWHNEKGEVISAHGDPNHPETGYEGGPWELGSGRVSPQKGIKRGPNPVKEPPRGHWWHVPETNEKRVCWEQPGPEWVRGQGKTDKSRGCPKGSKAYRNPETGEKIYLKPGEEVPEGFIKGWGERPELWRGRIAASVKRYWDEKHDS